MYKFRIILRRSGSKEFRASSAASELEVLDFAGASAGLLAGVCGGDLMFADLSVIG